MRIPTASNLFRHDTALGSIWSRWTEAGLYQIHLREPDNTQDATDASNDDRAKEFDSRIVSFCESGREDFDSITIDPIGWTDFSQRVYEACRQIRPGEVVTYKDLAIRVGSPKASRAVGAAMARNRILLVIPCHRVIATSGELRGFSAPGGLTTKQALLDLEKEGRNPSAMLPVMARS